MLRLMPFNARVWTKCPAAIQFMGDGKPVDDFEFAMKCTELAKGAVAHVIASNALKGYANLFLGLRCKRYIPEKEKEQLVKDAKFWREQIFNSTPSDLLGYGIESTVRLESIIHEKNAKGKIDYFCYTNDHLFIFDYKHGQKPVDVSENEQLWLYAAGLLDTKTWWKGSKVTVFIIQPAIKSVSSQTKTADEVRILARTFENLANNALAQLGLEPAWMEYNPSINTCTWCDGQKRCLKTAIKERICQRLD